MPERGFAGGDAAAGAALGAWLGAPWGPGAAAGAIAKESIRVPGPFAGHLVAWGSAALAWRTFAG